MSRLFAQPYGRRIRHFDPKHDALAFRKTGHDFGTDATADAHHHFALDDVRTVGGACHFDGRATWPRLCCAGRRSAATAARSVAAWRITGLCTAALRRRWRGLKRVAGR